MPFIIDIDLTSRRRGRNETARIIRDPGEVRTSRRDGRAFGERWLESGENEARIGDVVVHQNVNSDWRALLVVEDGRLVEIWPDAEDSSSQWYDRSRFLSFRREVVRLASLDAPGRRMELHRQIGIAEERLRRRCGEEDADYDVCRAADPEGPAPAPELAAQHDRGWNRIREPLGMLRAAEAALGAVDAAVKAADPAGRRAALKARENALEAELEAVRRELAALPPAAPDGDP